jgi:hypothetical protein
MHAHRIACARRAPRCEPANSLVALSSLEKQSSPFHHLRSGTRPYVNMFARRCVMSNSPFGTLRPRGAASQALFR